MGFSQEFIEKVREATDIVELIGQHTVLKPSSKDYMGRCMFHADKTASLSVSPHKQLYHCFGCKASGTAFNFVQDHMGMGFPEAVEYLAQRAGIAIEYEKGTQPREGTEALYEANHLAYEAFRDKLHALPKDHPVWQYIEKRGMSEEVVKDFGIGYAPDSWDYVHNILKKNRFDDKTLSQCGLVIPRKSGKGYYDRFRDRLMFPIINTRGKCVGFGGRILKKDDSQAKYMNSPETPLFNKSRVLYGLNANQKFIREQDEAILVEGYMDLVSLAQFGVRNVAANLGTALTFEHAKLIKRMTANVLVLFDGDRAGISAAEKALPILLKAGLIPRGMILPDGQDPDDCIREAGTEAFLERLEQAPQLFDVVVNRWLMGYNNSAGHKLKLVERLAPVVSVMADHALRNLYLRELSAKINVDEKWLRSALYDRIKKQNRSSYSSNQPPMSQAPPPGPPPEYFQEASETHEITLKNAAQAELTLLGLAFRTADNFNQIEDSGVSEYLVHEGVKKLFEKARDSYRQAPESFDRLLASVLPYVDQPEKITQTSQDMDLGDELNEHRMVEDCIDKVKELHLKRKFSQLSMELKMNPTSEHLEEFVNIRKQLLGLRNIKENYEIEDE